MVADAGLPRPRNLKLLLAWLCTALIIGVYFALPDGDEGQEPRRSQQPEVLPQRQQDGGARPQGEVARKEELEAFGLETVHQVVT